MDDLLQFEALLQQAMSQENHARSAAERQLFTLLDQNRNHTVFSLLKLLRESRFEQVRSMCAVFLRQQLPRGEPTLFDKLPDGLQDLIKTELLAVQSSILLTLLRFYF
jgi:hypothetical protein